MIISEQLIELEEKVSLGLRQAFLKLIAFKKKNNSPMIVSRDGKVVAIPADEIIPPANANNE